MYLYYLIALMEENIAILIADLSGYTALTETHGPVTAADMVETFLTIVDNCLVGDTILHQRVGDEVMIISSSPDQLISTAVMLIQNCFKEHLFLQLHGGLHYGKVLKRNNHYFGSPINLTSRIANKANAGTFWCSSEFINALSNPGMFTFHSKEKHNFKNISEEIGVSELVIENAKVFYIDPICRMLMLEKDNAISHPDEKNIFFCSTSCRDIYLRK